MRLRKSKEFLNRTPLHFFYQRLLNDRLDDVFFSLGLASFTLIVRPSTVAPSNSWIAFCAAVWSGISTKAKPRLRLVNLSIMTLAELTSPYSAKKPLKSSSFTAKLKFET